MKTIRLQCVCAEYPKAQYTREGNTFIKGRIHSKYDDDVEIVEYDDCWAVLTPVKEFIGEIEHRHCENNHLKNPFSHYENNCIVVNVLYKSINITTEVFGSKPTFLNAIIFNERPAIKAKFRLHNIIIR